MGAVSERDLRYPGWPVALAAGVGIFCWSIPPFSFAVFLKPIAEEFGWSRESVSAAFGVSPLIAAISAAPVGHLIDRLGVRAIAIPSLVVAGGVFASRAFIDPPFWTVLVLFAASGLAGVGTSPIAYARVVSTWFDQRRGVALGLAISGAGVGATVHPLVAQALIDAVGWRRAHLLLGGLMVIVGVPTVVRFLTPNTAAHAPVRSAASGATLRQGLTSRVFWVLAAVVLCDAIASSSLTIHLPALLTDRGIPAGQSALALAALGGAAALGRLTTGWLLDRWFAGHISMLLLLVSASGVLLLAETHSIAVAAMAAAMVGFGLGGEADVTPFMISRYFGLRAFSALYGAMFVATGLAWAIGPALMGRAFDATGSYSSHLVALAVMLGAAAALLVTLPRYVRSSATVPMGGVGAAETV